MRVEIEAALRSGLARGGVDLGRSVELMAVEVCVEFLDRQLRRAPLSRQGNFVHEHIGQRDAVDLTFPIDVKRFERGPPCRRRVGLRR